MNKDLKIKARQLAIDELIHHLLPENENLEVEEKFRKMLLEGALNERLIEIIISNKEKKNVLIEKTMSIKELYDLLYKEAYTQMDIIS